MAAYFVTVFQTADAIETELVEEANKINLLEPRAYIGPDEAVRDLTSEDLFEAFRRLARGARSGIEGLVFPAGKAECGELLSGLMSRLMSCPPFRTSDPQKPLNYEAVRLIDEADVRAWLPTTERVIRLSDVLVSERAAIQELIAAADARRRPEDHLHQQILSEFTRLVREAAAIARSAEVTQDRLARYRSRRIPPRWVRVLGTIIAAALVIVGVAYPMVRPSASTILDAWIPASVYVVALLSCVYVVAARKREGKAR